MSKIIGIDKVLSEILKTRVIFSGSYNPGNFFYNEKGIPNRSVLIYQMLSVGPEVKVIVEMPTDLSKPYEATIQVKGTPAEEALLEQGEVSLKDYFFNSNVVP